MPFLRLLGQKELKLFSKMKKRLKLLKKKKKKTSRLQMMKTKNLLSVNALVIKLEKGMRSASLKIHMNDLGRSYPFGVGKSNLQEIRLHRDSRFGCRWHNNWCYCGKLNSVACGVTNAVKNVTNKVGNWLKELGKKIGSILPDLVGAIASFVLHAASQSSYPFRGGLLV